MRRVLIPFAGLLALSCSHRARTEAPALTPPAESVAAVSSIPELAPRPGE